MGLKLETVKDAIEVQGICIELASRLAEINETVKGLLPPAKEALLRASEVLDFFSDEVIANLKMNG